MCIHVIIVAPEKISTPADIPWRREWRHSANSTPLVIHTFNLCKVKSITMDDNCGEWVECMGVASGCGEQEVGVASGSGWNLWVWLLGVV